MVMQQKTYIGMSSGVPQTTTHFPQRKSRNLCVTEIMSIFLKTTQKFISLGQDCNPFSLSVSLKDREIEREKESLDIPPHLHLARLGPIDLLTTPD